MRAPRMRGVGLSALAAAGLTWGVIAPPSLGGEPRAAAKARGDRRPQSQGEELFLRQWEVNDPRGHGGDGLGPVFNERSCVSCHGQVRPGGGGPLAKNVDLLAANPVRRRGTDGILDPAPDRWPLAKVHPGLVSAGGIVLHRSGTTPTYADWRSERLGGSSARGRTGTQSLASIDANTFRMVLSHRNASALFGSGQIDAIDESVLEREAERQAWFHAEVKGRVARQKDGRVGRFGWKAQVPSLRDFVLNACAIEIGLETPTHHQATDPFGFGDKAPGLDMSAEDCDALIAYVHDLPAPVARNPQSHAGGLELFKETGCADCHKPSLGAIDGIYSDLLLHEMGSTLSDSGAYYGDDDESSPGATKPGEWRTPPLWGIADSAPYLHDGRAQSLTEAIRLHDGQGTWSVAKFNKMSSNDRLRLIDFLKSLAAPSRAHAASALSRAEIRALREVDVELGRRKLAGGDTRGSISGFGMGSLGGFGP